MDQEKGQTSTQMMMLNSGGQRNTHLVSALWASCTRKALAGPFLLVPSTLASGLSSLLMKSLSGVIPSIPFSGIMAVILSAAYVKLKQVSPAHQESRVGQRGVDSPGCTQDLAGHGLFATTSVLSQSLYFKYTDALVLILHRVPTAKSWTMDATTVPAR